MDRDYEFNLGQAKYKGLLRLPREDVKQVDRYICPQFRGVWASDMRYQTQMVIEAMEKLERPREKGYGQEENTEKEGNGYFTLDGALVFLNYHLII